MLQFYLQRLYKKNAKECFGKFTLIVDRPEIVLAKINAANLSDVCKNHLNCYISRNITNK